MKNKDLIEKLQQFSPEMDVCIYDWKLNIAESENIGGEPTSAGIYPDFEVGEIQDLTEEEKISFEEETGVQYIPCIALGFVNSYIEEERACRVCGCTDDDCSQCIAKTGKPCHWVEDDLCSACQDATKNPPPHKI